MAKRSLRTRPVAGRPAVKGPMAFDRLPAGNRRAADETIANRGAVGGREKSSGLG